MRLVPAGVRMGWFAVALLIAWTALSRVSPDRSALATAGSASGCAVDASVSPAAGLIATDHGAVQGVRTGAAYAFKGIPYAAPPVGAVRWRPPADAACWSGVRAASAFGNVCLQVRSNGPEGDEDCLTLNVWQSDSALSRNAFAPVMFFIHGGGNATGSSAEPVYDGRLLAEREGAIVVTINYRLGPLGFLATPALDAESDSGTSGNYGILDQIAALGWVQRNIGAFGGDTSRVLIFGESAGGVDVCTLVASPLAAGLFSRALIESGGCSQPSLVTVEGIGSRFVTGAGCASAADVAVCLRALGTSDVLNALPGEVSVVDPRTNLWHPAVDGYVLTGSSLDVIRAGNHNHVPLIIGSNADETGRYVPATVRTEQDYRQAVYQIAGMQAGNVILAQYPASAFRGPRQALVAVTTDANFVCPTRTIARAAATGQTQPVYRYFFTHAAGGAASVFGAFHGLELAYVFGTLGAGTGYTPSAADVAVSQLMMDAWGRFAATGDPNAAGAVAWPVYDPAADSFLRIDDPAVAGSGVRTDRCDFWDALLKS